jgi:phage protein D
MRSPLPGKSRRSASYSVSFPTIPSIKRTPTFVELIQKQNNHDVLVLRFLVSSPIWFANLKTGVPVKFTYKQGHLSKTWYGYVSFVSKAVVTSKIQMMEVYCVGSSFVFKEGTVRVFSKKTITEVVSEVCKEFGFNFIGEPHPRRFDQLVIAGHSYWEWINEHANKIGYGVYVEGTNLIFRPLDKLIDQTISEAPILSWTGSGTSVSMEDVTKTLDYFKVLNGELIERSSNYRSIKHVGGVNPITSAITSFDSNPKYLGEKLRSNISDVYFSEFRSDQVAQDDVGSRTAAEGAAHLSRFNLPAYAQGKGDPRIKPYSLVYIKNTGSLTDGYWIVKEVTHRFVRSKQYEVDLSLITDGTGNTETSSFRQANPHVIGIVNAGHILNLDALTLAPNTTKLQQPAVLINEANQGFNRTPARWVTTLRGN